MLRRADRTDWKTRYRELVHELEDKERRWLALENALRRAASQLAIAAMGQSPELDAQVGDIVELMRGTDTDALGRSLQRLADTLKRVERELTESQRIAMSPIASLDARMEALVRELLERIDAIPELSALPAERELTLKQAAEDRNWSQVIGSIADRVGTAVRALSAQRNELEAFLAEVQVQLAEFESWAAWQRGDTAQRQQDGLDLESSMQRAMQSLRDETRAAPSLAELKLKVQMGLETVAMRLEAFRAAENRRLSEAEARNRTLAREVDKLRARTDRMTTIIGEQQAHLMRDALTGAHSRYAYDRRIEEEWRRWQLQPEPLSYALWDLDDFKAVNDQYGHAAGDRLLQLVGRLFSEHKRGEDFFARLGGEEFVLLLPRADRASALQIVERLRGRIESAGFHHQGKPERITISCGITEFRDGDTPTSVYERADKALYRAKRAGRNCCVAL